MLALALLISLLVSPRVLASGGREVKRDFTNGDYTIYGPQSEWRATAPIMNNYTPFNVFEIRYEDPTKWTVLNDSGIPGESYLPFDDLDDGQGGWRLINDTDSEVIYKLVDNYTNTFNYSIVVGNQTGESNFYNNVKTFYTNGTDKRSRDLWTDGDFKSLPFTPGLQTVALGKDNFYTDGGCSEKWNFTATTTDADGVVENFSGLDSLTVIVPAKQPATVKLSNTYDAEFSATLTYNGVLPYLYKKGPSERIANITLEQEFAIGFCLDDD